MISVASYSQPRAFVDCSYHIFASWNKFLLLAMLQVMKICKAVKELPLSFYHFQISQDIRAVIQDEEKSNGDAKLLLKWETGFPDFIS